MTSVLSRPWYQIRVAMSSPFSSKPSGRSISGVGPEVDSDDPPALCKQRQDLAEHLDRADAAVQQDQRLPGTVDLVVRVEAVHIGVVTFRALVHLVSSLVDD
jgi:hypothetical protein